MSQRLISWMVLVALLLCMAACAPQQSSRSGHSSLQGKPAPEIQSTLLNGEPFSLRERNDGKVILLDFWATWCGPCIAELPVLADIAEEFSDKGVALYAVNLGDDPETIRAFLEQRQLNLHVVLDPQGELGTAYGVSSIPQLVLIDQQGVVKQVHVGYRPEMKDELRRELNEMIGEAPRGS